jgi:1A family penicillin-binding protein
VTASKTNEYLTLKKIFQGLKFILRLISLIGKPFYFLLVALVFASFITGYFVRTVAKNLINYTISLFLTITLDLPKHLIRRFKITISLLKQGKQKIFSRATRTIGFVRKVTEILLAYLLRILIFPARIAKKIYKTLQDAAIRPKKGGRAKKLKVIKKVKIRPYFILLLLLATLLLMPSFLFWKLILKDLPTAENLNTRKPPSSTKIYDRNGILLYTVYKDYNRTPIQLSEIPRHVILATLAIEDAEFYNHHGFSLRGILRAIYKNIKKGELTGGSTITQQLIKNTLLTPEKTLTRKLKEIVLAVRIEKAFSKDKILEMYLNEVGYGSTAYGIQEGARLYFGKDVKNLTLAEAAILAGIPKSPTQYSPFGPTPQKAIERQREVLRLMEENKFITKKQKEEAESQPIKYAPNKVDIKAPHFVMFVRDILEKKYGQEMILRGGLEVITTLDYNIQKLAESVVKEEVEKLKKLNVTNGAAVVLDPQTGEILAMVGSKDYFDQENDGNVNVTVSLRQPGSSIKIVNYAYALSNGYTPASILDDSPVTFIIPNQQPYTPKNYEGGYRGKLTLRSAFAESRNIPAVRVLNSYGVKNMIEMGRKMGITTWNDPKKYGLSLTLGGGEVKLLDLAYVYATVANYGKKPEMITILKIKTPDGKIIENFSCPEENIPFTQIASATSSSLSLNTTSSCRQDQVISAAVAFIITDILKDNNARAPAFGINSQLVIPKHPEVAVKTGTSNDLRDNLTIGYNQKYVVAVWVGNNNNTPMSRIASGVTGASPIFNKIMSALLLDQESIEWSVPSGLVRLPICPYTGTLACNGCPIRMEWFLENNKPSYTCTKEQVEKIISQNKKPQILDEAWSSFDSQKPIP